jgi:heat shock protein HslJ
MAGDDANDHPDCFWQADVDGAAGHLAATLADEEPDVLVVYDPDGGYGHPDHIQVHRVGHRWAEIADIDRVRWVTMNRDAIRASIEAALADEGSWSDEGMLELRRERAESESFGMPDAEITATFVRGKIAGSAGCNDYTGSYQTSSDATIRISDLKGGRKACDQAIMDQENAYLSTLATAVSFQVQGDQLVINTAAAPLQYRTSGK